MSEGRADYSRQVVAHAVLTAFALDAVGYALEGYSREEREEWVAGPRSFVPKNRTNHRHDNRGTVNTLCTAFALEAVASLDPGCGEDLAGFKDRYEAVAAEYRQSFRSDVRADAATRQLDDAESLVPSCVALAVACYAAIRFDGVEGYYDLVVPVLQAIGAGDEARQTAFVAGYLANTLVHSGFFIGEDVRTLLSRDLCPARLVPAFEAMSRNAGSYAFLRDPFKAQLVHGLPYPMRALAETVFHLLRIGDAGADDLDNLPREQLKYVLCSPNVRAADLGFLFGLLCLCSEHEHCLVLHDLRESAERRKYVEGLLAGA